jgi:hypothetical protein
MAEKKYRYAAMKVLIREGKGKEGVRGNNE